HCGRIEIAALDQAQRVEQMAPEHLGAAAIIGERYQRLDRMIPAHVGAEIAFEPPECGGDGGRHAVLLLGTIEDRLVFADFRSALLEPVGGQHLAGEFEKALREDALAAVDIDDALVVDEIWQGGVDGALGNALRRRFGLEAREPAFEAARRAAVGGCRSRGCGEERCRECGGSAQVLANPNHSSDTYFAGLKGPWPATALRALTPTDTPSDLPGQLMRSFFTTPAGSE